MYGEKPPETPAWAVNGMTLKPLLKSNPELDLRVRHLKSGTIYRLALNSEGQLSYIDGTRKWTISYAEEDNFALTEESLKQIELLSSPARKDGPADHQEDSVIKESRLDTYTLIRGLNNFIDSIATAHQVDFELPEGIYGDLCTPIATVNFQLTVPSFIEAKSLARQYFLLIRRRLQELEDKLDKQVICATRLLTKGLVKNTPGLRDELEKRLRSARIHYAVMESNGDYFRLEAWKENQGQD
jgi:hypothetical protein